MKISDKLIKKVLRESLEQITEEANPAYSRSNDSAANVKAIWAAIDKKQKELYDYVFGTLSGKIYDITEEKARVMSQSFGKDYNFSTKLYKTTNNSNYKT